ncbi:MAG: FMN-binding protein [Candidatus Omnitrophica bacterium]|nr:FMN-binding protein [Candidatus Omnitrophota bacterium]
MKEKIKIVFFVFCLGSVCGGFLSGINAYTRERILRNQELKIKTAVLNALEIDYPPEKIEEVFSKNIEKIENKGRVIYRTAKREVAILFSGPGLWGNISGVLALKPDLETIQGIQIISQEETPGLGGRIAEKSFLERFVNKKTIPRLLLVPEGKAKRENEVDAITGATMTSRAFEELLNKSIADFRLLLKKE